ncbi:LysR substrate-binding domain-containing protein [Arenibaculum pallidiluteum]|uniref:LysR substrate-binding domain-containing protein n=1 Tax=Arenibaculum pallidiluteum TaxID=2812559 RepID=UPI001A96471F|nr:LysR substrate-binding domain-containing protein [Arenibaculum pallidiluteum]
MPLPPLSAVRCFEAAARHGSFTRAAEELGLTQAAVSYQIRLLEDRYGPLFLRKPRGVELTEGGRILAPRVSEAFAALNAAFDGLEMRSDGVLSITAATTFASNWLVPRLGGFQHAHPGITIHLDTTARLVDFSREEFDLGVRVGIGGWPGLVAHRLMPEEFTPMLGPALLAAAGPLRIPADLLRLPLIEPGDPWWLEWFGAVGLQPGDLGGRAGVRLGTQQLAGSAAMAGQGVAILSPPFFRREIETGSLVAPFPQVHVTRASYWLVYPEARRRSRKVRAFRDWLLGVIAEKSGAQQAAPSG